MSDIAAHTEEIERLRARVEELEAEQERDAEGLRDRLKLFEAMMETVPVGVVVADARGEVLFGNDAIENMVRHPVLHSKDADSYGEWVSHHPDGRRVESHEYPLARVLREDIDRAELDVCYERGDRTTFWMKIVGEAIRDEEGRKIGAAVATIDIDEEVNLRRAQDVLIAELNHRVKNAFSVTQAIVNRTLRSAGVDQAMIVDLDKRLMAYADAHAKLVGTKWGYAPVADLAREVLQPIAGGRISIDGPHVELSSRSALTISMVFYELATNAVKHGALSADDGRIDLTWEIDEAARKFTIDWRERGGPPAVTPSKTGFGVFITQRAIAAEAQGKVETKYTDRGFEWQLTMPLPTNEDP